MAKLFANSGDPDRTLQSPTLNGWAALLLYGGGGLFEEGNDFHSLYIQHFQGHSLLSVFEINYEQAILLPFDKPKDELQNSVEPGFLASDLGLHCLLRLTHSNA